MELLEGQAETTAVAPPAPQADSPPRSPLITGLRHVTAVVVSLLAGWIALGLFTTHNDFPINYHIDEPGKARQLLDPDGYRNFNHPQLMLEVAEQVIKWTQPPRTPQAYAEAGRFGSAIVAAAGVSAIALAGYVLYGWMGLLIIGAAMTLCPPLLVYAHYLKEDAALGGGILLTLMSAAMVLRSRRRGSRAAAIVLLGIGCGLTISGKYVGLMIVLPALVALLIAPGWNRWTLPARILPFVLSGVATIAIVNHRAFEDPWRLQLHPEAQEGIQRETRHGITDHGGFAIQRPHAYFLRIANAELMLHLKLLGILGLIGAVWRGGITRWGIASALFLVTFSAVLAFSAIPFGRYALPISLTAYFLCAAAIAAGVNAVPTVRWRLAALAVALFFIVLFQARQCQQINHQFLYDSRQLLRQWVAENIPARTLVAADRYAQLHQPGDVRRFPDQLNPRARVVQQSSVSDLGSLEQLRARGFEYIVVCGLMYDRFEIPGAGGIEGREDWFNRRREFYRELFATGELVWQYRPEPVTHSNLSPEIRVYRVGR